MCPLRFCLACALILCEPLVLGFGLASYEAEIDFLISQGPRLTGSRQHNNLIDRIESQLKSIGLQVFSDQYQFNYLANPLEPLLTIENSSIPISAGYPYGGTTTRDGIIGELVRLDGPLPLWSLAVGKIAVVPLNNPILPLSAVIQTWNPTQSWGDQANPLIPAEIVGLSLAQAKRAGVLGVVFAWDDSITDGNAHGQYVPFTNDYAGIPAVYTSGQSSATVLEACKLRKKARMILDSQIVPETSTRTLYSIVEGHRPNETVLVVTHTDGTNVVEENGHIGLLQLAQDAADTKPNRTHVFVFTTGHLRIPAFTSKGQATTRWLNDHPEYWQGKNGNRQAVAGFAIEHLGALHWKEDTKNNTFFRTDAFEPELLYANTKEMARLGFSYWHGVDPSYTRMSKPSSFIQFGEGAPLSDKLIPSIALVTEPVYLLAQWAGNERELINIDGLTRQVNSFRTLREVVDSLQNDVFGKVEAPGPLNYLFDGLGAVLAVGGLVLRTVFGKVAGM